MLLCVVGVIVSDVSKAVLSFKTSGTIILPTRRNVAESVKTAENKNQVTDDQT
jgi:hypothetical protein